MLFVTLWKRVCETSKRYMYPLQIITAGAIMTSGDVICQTYEIKTIAEKEETKKSPDLKQLMPTKFRDKINYYLERYDYNRARALAIFGFCVMGPVGCYWYPFIDRFTRRLVVKHSGWKFIFTKVFFEQAFLAPVYTMAFFLTVSAAEGGEAWATVGDRIKRDFIKTLVVDEAGWFMVSPIIYAFIPIPFQLVASSFVSVCEAMCFSYIQHNGFPTSLSFLNDLFPNQESLPLPEAHDPITTVELITYGNNK